MNAMDLLSDVFDQESFMAFVEALLNERVLASRYAETRGSYLQSGMERADEDAFGWRNCTIEDFLNASLRWAKDSKFGEQQGLSPNAWHRAATFLFYGKLYE